MEGVYSEELLYHEETLTAAAALRFLALGCQLQTSLYGIVQHALSLPS